MKDIMLIGSIYTFCADDIKLTIHFLGQWTHFAGFVSIVSIKMGSRKAVDRAIQAINE